MKTKLLFLLLMGFGAYAQNAVLKNPNVDNEFEVRLEDNKKEQIEITIIDSKKNTIAHKLIEKEDTPVSLINSNIFKKIAELSADYHYKIPDTDIVITANKKKSEITATDFVPDLKKLKKDKFISLLKKAVVISKTNYKDFVKSITTVNDPKNIFPGNDLKFTIKKTSDTEYKLFNDATEIKAIDPDNEEGFYDILYESVKNNDNVIKLFVPDDVLESFKNTDFVTAENTKELEKIYNKMKGQEKVTDYNYLGYIGTNFDLVEGVKAKNVFFAVNILSKPKRDKDKIGFYVSLYGNRTLSKIDSIKNIRRDYRVYDTIINNQTQTYAQNQLYDYSKTISIDNLGAYFSPLIKVWKLSNLDGATQFFLSPSLEFIWRRISIVNKKSNIRNETPYLLPGAQANYTVPLDTTPISYQYNAYDFNMGGGFWLIHENPKISVRLNMNVGWIRSFAPDLENRVPFENSTLTTDYQKKGDIFYTGKLWITEASTGVTLQAEILNTLNTPNPFYGVTLSKAFDFEKLGNFFKPIVSGKQ